MANEQGGTGGGPNPRDVSNVNQALQQQLVIMNQLRQAIASMGESINQYCETSEKCFSGDQWQKVSEQAGTYTEKTKGATQVTNDLTKKVGESANTFKKLLPTIGGVVGGLSGLKQGFQGLFASLKGAGNLLGSVATGIFDIGRSILTVPFKMLKGLQEMAMADSGGSNGMQEALEELRKEFGFLGPTSSTIKDLTSSMAGFNDTGLNAMQVFGTAAERMKYLTALAKEMGPQFAANAEEFKKNGGALLAYQKGLGVTGEQMGAIGIRAKTMGTDMGTVLNDMTKQALHMGKAFNLDAKVISKDMGKAMADVGHFGHLTTQQLGSAVVYANKLGVSIDKLSGLMDQFDTFDKAAESTSKLNEQFGTNIDAMDLMAAQNPAEKMEILRKSFQATGKDMSQLSFQERKFLQQQTGLDAATFDAAMSQKDQGDMLADINKESKKAEDTTLKQADAMKQLAVQIERVVQAPAGGGSTTFGGKLTEGFVQGITSTLEFKKVLLNLKTSMHIVGKLGFDIGKKFVAAFPGVKMILEGLAELFDPARYKKMADGVRKAITDFQNGTIKDFDGLMLKLKEVFFNFFDEGTGPGKKIIAGFKKFFEAMLKVIAGLIKFAADALANMIVKLVEMLKNPSSVGGMPGMGGFLKMFQPVIDAVIYAFNKLVPLILPILMELGKKIFAFITSEPFLGFLKKAGPIIALVLFGPSLLKSLTGALTGALTAAATDAIKSAFLGPGSKKISEMSGKEFSKLMSGATPPPAPAGAGASIIPPGTPDPATTAKAQATGSIISADLIIKLLLALAAIITIGLIAFYVAAQMAKDMSEQDIKKTLMVLVGVSIAILPAAGALMLLSGVPASSLLAAIPALVAIGIIIPYMADMAADLAAKLGGIPLPSIIKALVLILGMSIAIVPAAYALSLVAGAAGPLVGGAALILAGLAALVILVPVLAVIGVLLAEKVANIKLENILKAIILLVGMSAGLAIAAGAMAALIGAGALAGGVPIMLAGIAAVGLIAAGMFYIAPGLVEAGSGISLGALLKSLVIMAEMALAIIITVPSMAALIIAGGLSLVMPVILMGLEGFSKIALAMLALAPEIAHGGRGVKLLSLLKSLAVLALMAVAVAETAAIMVGLAFIGILVAISPAVVLGLVAFGVISIGMIALGIVLGEVASKVNVGNVVTAAAVLGIMTLAVATTGLTMIGLVAIAGLTLLSPLILLGLIGFGVIAIDMIALGMILGDVAAKVDKGNIGIAMAVLVLMSIVALETGLIMIGLAALGVLALLSPLIRLGLEGFGSVAYGMIVLGGILGEIAANVDKTKIVTAMAVLALMTVVALETGLIMIGLVALGVLTTLAPLIVLGLIGFGTIAYGMIVLGGVLGEVAGKINAGKVSNAVKILGMVAVTIAEVLVSVLMLVALGALLTAWFVIKAGIVTFAWTVEALAKSMPDIAKDLQKLGGLNIVDGLKTLGTISAALAGVGAIIAPLISLAIVAMFGLDISKSLKLLAEVMSTMIGEVLKVAEALVKMPEGKGLEVKTKMFKEIMEAVGALASTLGSVAKAFKGGILTSADDSVKLMASFNVILKTMMNGLIDIVKTVLDGIAKIGASNQMIEAAKSIASVLAAVGTLAAALKPPEAMTKAADAAIGAAIGTGLVIKGTIDIANNMAENLKGIINVVVEKLLPAIAGKSFKKEDVEGIAIILESIAKLAVALQPPAALLSALEGANPAEIATLMGSVATYIQTMGPVLNTLITTITAVIPPMVSAIKDLNLTSSDIEALKAIAPIIAAIGSLAGALVAPISSFIAMIEGGGGFFDDPKPIGESMKKIKDVLAVMQGAIMDLVGPGGPLMAVLDAIKAIDPAQLEGMGKLAPVISGIAGIAGAMTPKPEVLKMLTEADEAKFKQIIDGIQKISGAIGASVGTMLQSLVPLFQAISGAPITTEQVALLKELSPIISAVIGMTSKMVEGFLGQKDPPTAESVAVMTTFFSAVGAGMSDMFAIMGVQIDKIMQQLIGLLDTLKKKGIKPEELKAGAEALLLVFSMLGQMTDSMKKIQDMLGPPPKEGELPKVALWNLSLRAIGTLVNALFGPGGAAAQIVTLLSSPAIKTLGENKDGIAALMSAFDFIGKLPGTLKSLKDVATTEGGDIDTGKIVKQVQAMTGIISGAFPATEITKLTDAFKNLEPLGKIKDQIKTVGDAFGNVSDVSTKLAQLRDNQNFAGEWNPSNYVGGTNGITGLAAILEGMKDPTGKINAALPTLKLNDVSTFGKFTGDTTLLANQMVTVRTNLGRLDSALTDLTKPGEALGRLKLALEGFTASTLTNTFTELQKIATAVQDLDNAMANIGKIDIKQRIAKIAGGAGLDGGGVYTVKSKDVNINVMLTVTMEAGSLEKVILTNSNSTIKKAFDFTANGLDKSSSDTADATGEIRNLMRYP